MNSACLKLGVMGSWCGDKQNSGKLCPTEATGAHSWGTTVFLYYIYCSEHIVGAQLIYSDCSQWVYFRIPQKGRQQEPGKLSAQEKAHPLLL